MKCTRSIPNGRRMCGMQSLRREIPSICWYRDFPGARRSTSGLMVFSMGTRDEHINGIQPLEHWRTNLVDLDKGPFIGRAALEKIIADGGPSRKIIGLAGGSEPLARIERPCKIKCRDKDIGVTRSLAFSPSLQRNICLALVDRKYIDKGLNLVVEHPDGMVRNGSYGFTVYRQGRFASKILSNSQ